MISYLKYMAKHSGIYMIGNVSSKLIGLILLPLYTSMIRISDYGFYSLFDVSIQFCQGFLHLGLPNALFRWLNLEEDEENKKAVFFTAYTFTALIVFLMMLPLYFFSGLLAGGIFSNPGMSVYFKLSAFIITLSVLNMIPLFTLRVREKSLYYVIVAVLKFTLQLLVTVLMIVRYEQGILGIFWGQLAGELLAFCLMLPFVMTQISFRFMPRTLKEMIRFGFPLSFSGLASRVLNIGDRYVLGFLTTLEMVGAYDIGYRIANAVDIIFIRSFNNAYQQMIWKHVRADNIRRIIRKFLNYFLFVFLWIILAVSVFSYDLVNLMTVTYDEYLAASVIIPTILLALVIRGMGFIFKQTLQMASRTAVIATITITSAVLNIGLNFLMIPWWGMQGAAVATLLSFLVSSGISAWLSEKYFETRYEWLNMGKLFLSAALIYLSIYCLPDLSLVSDILAKLILLSLFPLILYLLRFYEFREIETLKNMLKKQSRKGM
ncbi:MAG: polysaccharide biosynthesis C-terminal domain-containing protein [Fidelibacterota bacterium]